MLKKLFCYDTFKEDYKVLNTEVRKLGYNIPPLVNAYMSLSPTMRMFGTAINDGFGDVEEDGILIAVDEILRRKTGTPYRNSLLKDHPEAMRITSGANPIVRKSNRQGSFSIISKRQIFAAFFCRLHHRQTCMQPGFLPERAIQGFFIFMTGSKA